MLSFVQENHDEIFDRDPGIPVVVENYVGLYQGAVWEGELASSKGGQGLFISHSKTAPKQGRVCTHSKSRQNPPSLTRCYQ